MDPYTVRLIKATFKIWAPDSSVWSSWAKPVLFFNFKDCKNTPTPKQIKAITECRNDTAVIIDMPAEKSVEEGLYLAGLGYRPVPLYNGVCESTASMAVDVKQLQTLLFGGADILNDLRIKDDAPPCFLLDSGRFEPQGVQHGKYDNRWRVFAQDMPSADFLTKNGISKLIIRTQSVDNDISHVLLRYQNAGIKILLCSGEFGENLKNIDISKPKQFKSLSYRFNSMLSIRRNTAGGFGASIKEMKEGGYYGGGYYGGYYGRIG